MNRTITDWLKLEQFPGDFYELLGKQRFDPDRGRLQEAIQEANRELYPYQNHRDAAVAQRAMRLLWELGRAADALSDPVKLLEYHNHMLRSLGAEYAAAHRDAKGAWEPHRIQTWLTNERNVHPGRSSVLALALCYDRRRTSASQFAGAELTELTGSDPEESAVDVRPIGEASGESAQEQREAAACASAALASTAAEAEPSAPSSPDATSGAPTAVTDLANVKRLARSWRSSAALFTILVAWTVALFWVGSRYAPGLTRIFFGREGSTRIAQASGATQGPPVPGEPSAQPAAASSQPATSTPTEPLPAAPSPAAEPPAATPGIPAAPAARLAAQPTTPVAGPPAGATTSGGSTSPVPGPAKASGAASSGPSTPPGTPPPSSRPSRPSQPARPAPAADPLITSFQPRDLSSYAGKRVQWDGQLERISQLPGAKKSYRLRIRLGTENDRRQGTETRYYAHLNVAELPKKFGTDLSIQGKVHDGIETRRVFEQRVDEPPRCFVLHTVTIDSATLAVAGQLDEEWYASMADDLDESRSVNLVNKTDTEVRFAVEGAWNDHCAIKPDEQVTLILAHEWPVLSLTDSAARGRQTWVPYGCRVIPGAEWRIGRHKTSKKLILEGSVRPGGPNRADMFKRGSERGKP